MQGDVALCGNGVCARLRTVVHRTSCIAVLQVIPGKERAHNAGVSLGRSVNNNGLKHRSR
jgi:hypothetical protein